MHAGAAYNRMRRMKRERDNGRTHLQSALCGNLWFAGRGAVPRCSLRLRINLHILPNTESDPAKCLLLDLSVPPRASQQPALRAQDSRCSFLPLAIVNTGGGGPAIDGLAETRSILTG